MFTQAILQNLVFRGVAGWSGTAVESREWVTASINSLKTHIENEKSKLVHSASDTLFGH